MNQSRARWAGPVFHWKAVLLVFDASWTGDNEEVSKQ